MIDSDINRLTCMMTSTGQILADVAPYSEQYNTMHQDDKDHSSQQSNIVSSADKEEISKAKKQA